MATTTSTKRNLTPAEVREARNYWENTPDDKKAKSRRLADEYGVHPNTIRQRAMREGWADPDEGEAEAIAVVREAAADIAPEWMDQDKARRLEARVLELERELAGERATIESLRPDVDVEKWLYTSVEEVIEFHGEDRLRENAMEDIAQVNKDRMRRGHPGLTADQMTVTNDQVKAEARRVLADRRNAVPNTGILSRMVKMVAPVKDGCKFDADHNPANCYQHGSLRCIPFEAQINNMRGSLYDATQRYLNKGFKITTPFLCMGGECTEPSAVDARGKFLYGGYCSEDHRKRTAAEGQGDSARQVIGAVGAGR